MSAAVVAKTLPPTRAATAAAAAALQKTTSRPSSSSPSPLVAIAPRRRTYYSYEAASASQAPLYSAAETAMLGAALAHVPAHGFTHTALRQGAQDAGYREASTNLFPGGPFELVLWHLRNQRTTLKERRGGAFFPPQFEGQGRGRQGPKVAPRVSQLVQERLRGNVEAGVQPRLQEAIALMSLPGNIPPSLRELFLLSDEVWFLAGDEAVDTSWYTKRATLASIYAATEVYSTTDQSTEFRDTAEFLERRLEEARVVGGAWRNVKEWVLFQGLAGVNLARSWGAKI